MSADQAYGNNPVANLPFQFVGSAGDVGMGASSGLSVEGITASLFGIGRVGGSPLFVIDTSGNAGIADNCYVGGTMSANEVLQNSVQVLDNLTSSGTITITGSGATRNLEVASTGTIAIGGVKIAEGNGGDPSIALPNYGSWWLELTYGAVQTNNVNFSVTLSVIAGSVSSFGTNADGQSSFNAVMLINMYAVCAAAGNQTVTFGLSVGGASFAPSPYQPWTIRATRTA